MANQLTGFGQPQPQPQTQVRLTPDKLTPIVCESCKGEYFTEGLMLREVSPLLTQDGQPKMAPIPVFICLNCKEVLQKTIPEALRTKKIIA
jgi:hypothetical protein